MGDRAPPPASTPLGTTGMNITRVGVGTWAIGGPNWAFGWGPQNDAVSVATIRQQWSVASTESIPPLCTASATRRKW
jgi:hypothetical protein